MESGLTQRAAATKSLSSSTLVNDSDTVNRYTRQQVEEHHTATSLWVIYKSKVYDITHFMFDHPGGEEILLQYGGKDITEVFHDANEHDHSDAAIDLLADYLIGNLEENESSAQQYFEQENRKKKADIEFLDPSIPLLKQVWGRNFSKETYVKHVHMPRHTSQAPRLFEWDILEPFSRCYWWMIPLFWTPVISYCLYQASKTLEPVTIAMYLGVGLFLWTLIEYTLHRFLFHVDDLLPDHRIFITLHFVLHGIHHFLPMDKTRLVMPPALGFTLAYPIWSMYVAIAPGGHGQAAIAGSMLGFVLYDLTHYYLHHGTPLTAHLRSMKTYHLDHHYKNAHLGYGITSKLWDYVFGTVLV